MARFVLQLCCDAPRDDIALIGMIGVSPLENWIDGWSDAALALVEAAVDNNPVLLQALTFVWTRQPAVRERIDAILGARGETRA
ncbi:MAG TPA: hypothetical protein VK790_07225 [Solirubrobacteraceae bacterium]|nr:hypothetical protein [Solirubrobacteraceae bacterium]